MKCKLCKRKTDWDESYGRPCFIVCPSCHRKITKMIGKFQNENCLPETIATMLILEMGYIKEEREEKKNGK